MTVGEDACGILTSSNDVPKWCRYPGQKWRHQGKDNGKSQEEHVHSNGGMGKAENSQMTSYPVEDGSMPAQTEVCLEFKVRC
jgi:hypothetical protein